LVKKVEANVPCHERGEARPAPAPFSVFVPGFLRPLAADGLTESPW